MNRIHAHAASIAFCAALFIAGQHSAKAAETPFDDIAIPDSVMASLNAARAGKQLWMPKFKKISSDMLVSHGDKDSKATTEIEVLPNGLLRTRSTSSNAPDSQAISFGGIVHLKSQLKGESDDQIRVTTKLDLELPAELTLGAKIVSQSEMEYHIQQDGDMNLRMDSQCVVKERIDANTIFPKLTGKAAKLDCQYSYTYPERPDSTTYKTITIKTTTLYLEDLGLPLQQEIQTPSGSTSFAITRMDIER